MDIKTKIGPLEIFFMNDQPFTCPQCGGRCMEIGDFYHTNAGILINQCLNEACRFICAEEEVEEFLNTFKTTSN